MGGITLIFNIRIEFFLRHSPSLNPTVRSITLGKQLSTPQMKAASAPSHMPHHHASEPALRTLSRGSAGRNVTGSGNNEILTRRQAPQAAGLPLALTLSHTP